jgi:hypothetical protein
VFDFPGLLKPDHDRFVKDGGWISWEFVTLLVCTENPADQKNYLVSGLVQAFAHYGITRTYTAGNDTPAVKVEELTAPKKPIGPAQFFKQCLKLTDILKSMGLRHAYDNPRPHMIKFP